MSVKHKIYRQLRDDIIFGKISPGQRLIEVQLSRSFDCSRGPIREALIRLGREGFVNMVPHKGAVVAKPSAPEIEDYYALLALLESTAVAWSTPRLNFSDVQNLLEINSRLKGCLDLDGEPRLQCWHDYNEAFHRLFWNNSGNAKLTKMIESVRMRIFRYRYTSLTVTSLDDCLADHTAIVAAVRTGDANMAQELMQQHVMRAFATLVDFFSKTTDYTGGYCVTR